MGMDQHEERYQRSYEAAWCVINAPYEMAGYADAHPPYGSSSDT